MTGIGSLSGRTVDLAPLIAAAAHLDTLTEAGWKATDQSPRTVRLSHVGGTDVQALLSGLEPLGDALVGVRVTGQRSGSTIEIGRVGTEYEVVGLPDVVPRSLFDDPYDLELAAQAWDKNAAAAFALPFTWRIDVSLGLDRLVAVPPLVELRAVLSPQPIIAAIETTKIGDLQHLFPSHGARRVYLALNSPAEHLHLGAVTLAGLAGVATEVTSTFEVPPVAVPLPGEVLIGEPGLTLGVPLPSDLLPLDGYECGNTWKGLRDRCEAFAALATWAMIASEVAVEGADIFLDFLGFKRVRVALPSPENFGSIAVAGALKLRRWVFHDASPDRFLAVRQVVSLYQGHEALMSPHDVLVSAEIIYVGLRSNAVAEVVKSTREAQSQTLDTARQSLKAVQDLSKGATERLLAALVALGGVVVANASRSLSDHVGRELMLLVAAFLVGLGLFAIFVEGPLLSLPLKTIDGDLRAGVPLLTEGQLHRVTAIPSVAATKNKVKLLRWIIPAVYIGLAALVVLFGYPSRYR